MADSTDSFESRLRSHNGNGIEKIQKSLPSSSSSSLLLIVQVVRCLLIDVPLMVLLLSLLLTISLEESYLKGPIHLLINSFVRGEEMDREGYYAQFDQDMTYYNRQCGPEDITTRDSNDLLVSSQHTQEQAADVMMTHGAVVIPQVLSNTTAVSLRHYLEGRNQIREILPWHEKFWEGEDGERLALGLGAHDHPVITQALYEVGTNPTVQKTIEGLMGADPAIVEISTMTSIHGAPHQGIHTDSDYFGSSLLYARNFLHSYTMFMALQDTTPRMGATTVCPGSHHCANYDLEDVCLQHGAFEVSSNGKTGSNNGAVFQTGDAMIFNQNVWHRGPSNNDPNFPINRVMFIVTFITRTKAKPKRQLISTSSDYRQQAWGTYYYQRWNMWGHTYSDLSKIYSYKYWGDWLWRQPVAALRALGLWKPADRNWGITWMEQFARQIANDEDFYNSGELPAFVQYMDSIGIPKWLQGYNTTHQEEEDEWDPFLRTMLRNWITFLQKINLQIHAAYLAMAAILSISWWMLFRWGKSTSSTSFSNIIAPAFLRRLIVSHGLVLLLYFAIRRGIDNTELVQKLESKELFSHRPFDHNVGHDDSIFAAPEFRPRVRPTTMPEREDVLIGTRFDSQFLGIYNKMLDYHPGNQVFNQLVAAYSGDSTSHVMKKNTILPASLINPAVESMKRQLVSTENRRFLEQDHTDGYWTVMTTDRIHRTIRRAVLMKRHLWKQKVGTELLEILAESRFGAKRHTIMMFRYTPHFVAKFQKVLFEEDTERESATTIVRPVGSDDTKKLHAKTSPLPLLFPLPSIQPLSPRIDPSKHKRRLNSCMLLNMDATTKPTLPDEIQQKNNNKQPVVMKSGDRVWVQYNMGDRWKSGRIAHIFHQDKAFIQVDGNRGSANYDVQHVRPYYPMVEGDIVDVKVSGKTWVPAELLAVHPRGLYTVQLPGRPAKPIRVTDSGIRKLGEAAGMFDSTVDDFDYSDHFDIGDRIIANYHGEGEWFDGVIGGKSSNGKGDEIFNIHYDDGDFEANVPVENLLSAIRDEEYEAEVEEEEEVIVNFKGSGQWLSATVMKVFDDGRCNVVYSSSKKRDRFLRPQLIRRLYDYGGE